LADEATVLRLFTFRTAGSTPAFDVVLRDDVLPRIRASRGFVDAYAGRHGTAETGDRVIAEVWASRPDMDAALGAAGEESLLGRDHLDQVRAPQLDVVDIEFGVREERRELPRVLRVFRGQTTAGELRSYIADVRSGAMRDVAAIDGLVSLYLACREPDRFITVSAWTDWDSIALATGADVQRPAATRNVGRIRHAAATHYEILPDTSGSSLGIKEVAGS
jgi:hypothetical protein